MMSISTQPQGWSETNYRKSKIDELSDNINKTIATLQKMMERARQLQVQANNITTILENEGTTPSLINKRKNIEHELERLNNWITNPEVMRTIQEKEQERDLLIEKYGIKRTDKHRTSITEVHTTSVTHSDETIENF